MKPRVHWDAVSGWVVDTPISLSKRQLKACVDWTVKIQSERIRSMPHGDRREQAVAALKRLSVDTLKVNLLPESGYSGGERVLYLQDKR